LRRGLSQQFLFDATGSVVARRYTIERSAGFRRRKHLNRTAAHTAGSGSR
jgi:hypothetical protein